MAEFKIPDITRLFGLKRNLVQQYLDRGFIEASLQRSTRRGEANIFSFADLCLVRFFQRLLEAGFTWEIASLISEESKQYFKRTKESEKKFLVGQCIVGDDGMKHYCLKTVNEPDRAYFVDVVKDKGFLWSGDFVFALIFNLEHIEKEVGGMV